jgi:hypothetical protein
MSEPDEIATATWELIEQQMKLNENAKPQVDG